MHNEYDAEDVVRNAFLWIINNLEKVSQVPDYERALYFSAIIENAALYVINRQKRHPLKDIDEYVDIASDYSVEDRASDNIMVNEIEKAFGELPDRDNSLMYLYVLGTLLLPLLSRLSFRISSSVFSRHPLAAPYILLVCDISVQTLYDGTCNSTWYVLNYYCSP